MEWRRGGGKVSGERGAEGLIDDIVSPPILR